MALDALQLIQLALIPAILISGAGLLALGIQNRYGRVIDRIRVFGSEMHSLREKWQLEEIKSREKILQKQLDILLKRGNYLKNSLFFIFLSILISLLTSIFSLFIAILKLEYEMVGVGIFIIAIFSFFIGILFATIEIFISYKAILIEVGKG